MWGCMCVPVIDAVEQVLHLDVAVRQVIAVQVPVEPSTRI